MKWLLDYIFNPVVFFDKAKKNKDLNPIYFLGGFLTIVPLYIIGHLLLAAKNVKVLNASLENLATTFTIDPILVYGLSIFSSCNFWLIWLLMIIYFICIDILFRDGEDYLAFIKLSGLSFYCILPYVLFIIIVSILYNPKSPSSPINDSSQNLIFWSSEAIKMIKSESHYILINDLGYFFNIWLITLLTASYKSFSTKSNLFCCTCGAIFMITLLWINLSA